MQMYGRSRDLLIIPDASQRRLVELLYQIWGVSYANVGQCVLRQHLRSGRALSLGGAQTGRANTRDDGAHCEVERRF